MGIPKNITKEHLLKSISKIDNDGIPKDGDSQYFDVIYNGKKYPPKLIVSYANIFANGSALNRNIFEGGIDTLCFKLLLENSFNIIKKSNMIIDILKSFCEEYKDEIALPHSSDLRSYKLLVNKLPLEIKQTVA